MSNYIKYSVLYFDRFLRGKIIGSWKYLCVSPEKNVWEKKHLTVVAVGTNIFEVTVRLFMSGGCYSLFVANTKTLHISLLVTIYNLKNYKYYTIFKIYIMWKDLRIAKKVLIITISCFLMSKSPFQLMYIEI